MNEKPIATYTVLPQTSAQIQASVETAHKLLVALEHWTPQTPEDEQKAAGLLTSAHGKWKELEALRKSVVKPASDAQRTINNHFRPALQEWDKVKIVLKRIMADAVAVREAANQARIESAAAGNAAALAQIAPVVPPAGVSYRDEVKIEIIDFDQIPRDFLTVDWSKLKIWAREGKEAPPGVQFVRQPKVVPTGRP